MARRELSPRLLAILERLRPGAPLWDLCCDHGRLGVARAARSEEGDVLMNDLQAHLIANARTYAEQWLAPEALQRCQFVVGPAEELPAPPDGCEIAIAGVGSGIIGSIMTAFDWQACLQRDCRFFLCSHTKLDPIASILDVVPNIERVFAEERGREREILILSGASN